jgi:hypothetical protein
MSHEEREIKNVMIFGTGFALFGLVCPFFWLSLFNGNSGSQTWVYAVHSGFFIAIGLIFLVKGWYDLRRVQAAIPAKTTE